MHTFKSVIEKLGPGAQTVGGSVIVLQGGKHVLIGRVSPETGSFVLTPAGLAAVNAAEPTPEPVEAVAEVKPTRGKSRARAAEPLVDTVNTSDDLSGDLSQISFEE